MKVGSSAIIIKKKYGNEVRPGGRIFKDNDKYYIPMQNMNNAYGTSITLYEISFSKGGIELIKRQENIIGPQRGKMHFNSAMHHIDIQKHDEDYIYFYDGQNFDRKIFSIKRTLKFNFLDIKSFVLNI